MSHPKGLVLVPLRWRDSAFCRALAARDEVRAASFDPRPPTDRGHLRWMWRAMTHGDRRVFIGVWRGGVEPVAVVTLGGQPEWVEIGVAVVPEAWGHGIATSCIRLACGEAVRTWGTEVTVVARIKPDNNASRAAFTKARFREIASSGDLFVEMVWTL